MEEKTGCCQSCKAPCAGCFKKVADLENSGLVIYLHTKKDEKKKLPSKYDDYLLHNATSREINIDQYVDELHKYKAKCLQCKTVIQKLRSLLDEIKALRDSDIVGVCEHCNQANNSNIPCKRCDFLVNKFIDIHRRKCSEKEQRFKVWLCKVKQLLQALVESETICQHKVVYKDLELERILKELKEPLSMREPDIDFFPGFNLDKLNSLRSLSQSKEMLEELLSKLKRAGDRRLSDDSLYPTPSGPLDEERPGLRQEKSKITGALEAPGELSKDLGKLLNQEVYKKMIKRLLDLSSALPQRWHENKEVIQALLSTFNFAVNHNLSKDIIHKILEQLRELKNTIVTQHLTKYLKGEVVIGLTSDFRDLLTLGSSPSLNTNLLQLLIDLTEMLVDELSQNIPRDQSQLLRKTVGKEIAQLLFQGKDLTKVAHKKKDGTEQEIMSTNLTKTMQKGLGVKQGVRSRDSTPSSGRDSKVIVVDSKRHPIDTSQGLPKSQKTLKDSRQGSAKSAKTPDSRLGSAKGPPKDSKQGTDKGTLKDTAKRPFKDATHPLSKGPTKETKQGSERGPQKDSRQSSPKRAHKDTTQGIVKETKQASPKGPSKDPMHGAAKAPPKSPMQGAAKAPPKDLMHGAAKAPPKDAMQGAAKALLKDPMHGAAKALPKDAMHGAAKAPPKDAMQGAAKAPPKDAMHGAAKAPPKDAMHGAAKAPPKDAMHGAAKAPPKDAMQGAAKATPKDAMHGAAKAPPKDAMQGAAKALLKDPMLGATKAPPKSPMHGAAKAPPKDAMQGAAKAPPKDAMQGAAKAPPKDAMHGAAKAPSKDPMQGAAKGPPKDPMQGSAKAPSKDPMQGAAKGPPKDPMQGAAKAPPKDLKQSTDKGTPKDTARGRSKDAMQSVSKGPVKETKQVSERDPQKDSRQSSPTGAPRDTTQGTAKETKQPSGKGPFKDPMHGAAKAPPKDPMYGAAKAPKDSTQASTKGQPKDKEQGLVEGSKEIKPLSGKEPKEPKQITDKPKETKQEDKEPSKEAKQAAKGSKKDPMYGAAKAPPKPPKDTSKEKPTDKLPSNEQGKSKEVPLGMARELNKDLVSKLKELTEEYAGGDLNKDLTKEVNTVMKKTIEICPPELNTNIVNELSNLCDVAVKNIPKPEEVEVIRNFLKDCLRGLSDEPNKKATKTVLSNFNKNLIKNAKTAKRQSKEVDKGVSKADKANQMPPPPPSEIQKALHNRIKDEVIKVEHEDQKKAEAEGLETGEKDASKTKAMKAKKTKEKKEKQSKKEKENLSPDKKIKAEQPKEEIPIKPPREPRERKISDAILLKMMKSDKERDAERERLRQERQLAKEELQRKKLKDFIAKNKPPPVRKKLEIVEELVETSEILEAPVQQGDTKYMVRGSKIRLFDPHYKDDLDAQREPFYFKNRLELPEADMIELKPQKIHGSSFDFENCLSDGIIRYRLSDREFIDKGWTKLPTKKIMRKMNIYKMEPVNPQYDWFERHKQDKELFYDTGSRLADIDANGRGHWYYRNGLIALDYYNAEESNIGQRYVVYSSGEEENGRVKPRTVLGLFDVLGNGVVYDHFGNVRLKYNQSEGLVLDPKLGPPGRWKWHTLNDPPVLQQVFVNDRMKDDDLKQIEKPEKTEDPNEHFHKQSHQEMLSIEHLNHIKEKETKLQQKFKPFQIRMKAVKLNEQFSLKIYDQSNIYLIFREGAKTLKINLGRLLKSDEIIDTDTSDMTDVATPYDKFPARSVSLENIQRILKTVRSAKVNRTSSNFVC